MVKITKIPIFKQKRQKNLKTQKTIKTVKKASKPQFKQKCPKPKIYPKRLKMRVFVDFGPFDPKTPKTIILDPPTSETSI
jgi:hypothetical protein